MILAHRIRLRPNNTQRTWLLRMAGISRFAFNWGLARWNKLYSEGKTPSWMVLNTELNSIKKTQFPWMSESPWRVANAALEDLGGAFNHFFRRVKQGARKKGYPRFKKKGRARNSFEIEGRALNFNDRRVKVPKLGWIRLSKSLRFPGRVISGRFTERAGHWYIAVHVEVLESWVYPNRCKTQAAVGMDLGLRDLAVLSTGEKIQAPRLYRKHETSLRRLGKQLSRRTIGGKNWNKTKRRLYRLHERVSNTRSNETHNLTSRLIRSYRWIGVEDLNISAMKRTTLAKSVSDAAMAEVLRQLRYKAPLAGSTIVSAGRFYPSSKTCSACGVVRERLELQERTWTCPACDAEHDRDINAARNLESLALAHKVTACCHEGSGPDRKVKTKPSLGQESGHYHALC